MKIVPDTSVIIDGRITAKVKKGDYRHADILIPEAVIFELESQANRGQETGMSGLEEIQEIKELSEAGEINLTFKGERPSSKQHARASEGEIDSIIRSIALDENAILITSDQVQSEVARAKGVKVKYLKPILKEEEKGNEILDYFTEDTMSVHLREGTKPTAKKGTPGDIRTEVIKDEISSQETLQALAHNIIENAERSSEGFIEVDKGGATVVQLENIRIVISRPPFSDGFEITAVRPVAKVDLEEYKLSEELKERFSERQRGVLLAGSPGAGKSTLAQAIANYLKKGEFTIKTMEDPRDLQVGDEITQYSKLDGKMEDTGDLLLLVRPDYTIYDEVRKTPDFETFADMRLAGVGMIGVTHANRAIDALQRLIGRVELGMVPQVVDTIVFVKEAEINKVYNITYTVKVPEGMVEEDLARPVIEVQDFETDVPEYEVYSYGEQVVVMPVEGDGKTKPVHDIAEKEIQREINRYVSGRVEVKVNSSEKVTVYVPDNEIPRLLGKNGKNISGIEKHLGVKIDVQPLEESSGRERVIKDKIGGDNVDVIVGEDKVIIEAGRDKIGKTVDLFSGNEYLSTVTVGQDGSIKIRKGTRVARQLMKDVDNGKKVKVVE